MVRVERDQIGKQGGRKEGLEGGREEGVKDGMREGEMRERGNGGKQKEAGEARGGADKGGYD